MRSLKLFLIAILTLGASWLQAQTTEYFTTPGTVTWTVPPCVTSITVEVWAGGGGGGACWSRFNNTCSQPGCQNAEVCVAGGGGGGGGFVTRTYAVVPGQTYSITVGAGGAGGVAVAANNGASPGTAGGNSTFSGPATVGPGILTAYGGAAGGAANFLNTDAMNSMSIHQGANGTGGVGGGGLNFTTRFFGGNGATGAHSGSSPDRSGAGGGGAGTTAAGGNATSVNVGGTGGTVGGGNGANGGNIGTYFGYQFVVGANGFVIGGGGSGGLVHNRIQNNGNSSIQCAHRFQPGGNGSRGEVRITYTAPTPTNPTFNPVAPICSGDPLAPLPTTSTNGVTGTWSPALDNTTTTIYTFTPTAGLCASTTTMTITVNPVPTISAQPQNIPICATGSATMSATATGGVYQWQYFDGSTWSNVVSGTPAGYTYANATTTSLGITTSNAANTATCSDAQFRLLVGSAPCQIISNSATVTVVRATRIAPTGPQCSGTQLNFDACPAGATYLWSVTSPAGTSATPTNEGAQTFSFTPTNTTAGNQVFTVNSSVTYLGLTCPQTFSPTITPAPNAGTNGTASVCATGTPINLYSSLSGAPAATGTWSGGLTGGNLGTYDPAALAPGTYTYTVSSPGCSDATAAVAVTETPGPNAGTNGTTSVCATGSAINLFSSLGGSPAATGTWSGGLSGGNLGTYDPATMTPGTYTYTVSLAGCADATATVAISETPGPNAGNNGTAAVCATGSPINLFSSLGGSPAATGSWSGGLTGGNLGTYDPATMSQGTFTYTVSQAGCADATANVIVTESPAPIAGTNGSVSLCATGTPVNLYSSLGGSPAATGIWSGGLTGGNLGTYDPTSMSPGTFTYTVSAAGCADATATVAVTETPGPVAGSNGTASVCATGSPVNLFSSLGGSPAATGTWSGGLTGGNLGTYDPATMTPGTFTYTVSSAGCADATATVAVTETPGPNAGSNGTTAVCATGSPINLFSVLGGSPSATGVWSGGLTGGNMGTYDPNTMTPGSFTYTVSAAGCVDATATVAVTETPGPNAGTNGIASICATGTPVNLFSSLGGSPAATGTWSGGLTGGNLGTYDPATLTPGTYTYTVSSAGCADATATVAVTESPAPNAGNNGSVSVCESGTPVDLFSSLGGTPAATGSWSGGLTGGNLGTYDPNTMTPGTFTYTVSAIGCADATSTVSITETTGPNAGSNGAISVCENGSPIDLYSSLGGTPDATGTWSGGLTGGNLGTYDPLIFSQGTFTYTVSLAGCADATASIIVTEVVAPNAGTDGALTLCSGTVPSNAQLLAALGGTPDAGGIWTNVGLVYTYTVSPTSPCSTPATANVTVTETAIPSAPSAYSDTTYCSGDVLVDLNVVGGTGTFTWYSDNALTNVIGTGLTLTPDNTLGTTVYYVTESNLGCQGPADSVFITINVCTLPDVEIAVPTAFTPNGDGTHDTWELVNLDAKYPKNKVYIYNRWGNLIFESKEGAYDAAPWDGSFNDKPMPVGSYYYMIYPDEKGSDEIIKGIVSIIKK